MLLMLLFILTLLCMQAVATQEAATQTNNQAQSNEYQLKTLTLWLLKVCYTTRGMPSAYFLLPACRSESSYCVASDTVQ